MKKLFVILCLSLLTMLVPYTVNAVDYKDYGFIQEEAETNLLNGQEDCLYIDFKDTYYKHGEYISIQFEIRNSEDSKGEYEYTVSADSNGVNLDKNIKILTNLSFEINFNSFAIGEYKINISADDNQGNCIQKSLYVFSTEESDFVSKTSLTQAKRQYFIYLYENKKVNEEDYNNIVYGYEEHTDITEFIEDTPSPKEFEE